MRLFVAVDLDGARREALSRTVSDLRRTLGAGPWGSALRWVPPDRLHLTIRFLGDVEDAQGVRLGESLVDPLAVDPFEIVFEGAGVFPPRGAPRVLWVGVASGGNGLARVFDALEARLRAVEIAPEARPFSPHLTLARFRDRAGTGRRAATGSGARARERLEATLATVRVDAGAQPVRSVTLYSSRPRADGPAYTPLVSTPLGGR